MTTPAKRKAESPAPKSPTPGPASPSPAPRSPQPADHTGILAGAHWLEQELLPEDDDSTLGSDVESSTASVASSILNYRTINGRTYHSDSVTNGEYWGPNDTKHQESLEVFAHAAELMIGGKLHLAPIGNDAPVQRAADIGTGSGLWAIDFADAYPECEVIGTDLSPIQPSWCPPNLRFEIEDATKDWTFKENYFDFIHLRFLTGGIKDWAGLYKQAYQACKPGGWIEHFDLTSVPFSDDDSVPKGSALEQYGKIFIEAGKRLGMTHRTAEDGIQENGLKEAGFVNITANNYKVSRSTKPTEV